MAPQAIALLIQRLRTIYDLTSKVAVKGSKLAAIYALLGPTSSQFSARVNHLDDDDFTSLYLMTLMWLQVHCQHESIKVPSPRTLSQLLTLGLDKGLLHMANYLHMYPSDRSILDTVDHFITGNASAYGAVMAPRWDGVLAGYFKKDAPHPIPEAYVELYHPAIAGNTDWLTVMMRCLPHARLEDIRVQMNKIRTAALGPFLGLNQDQLIATVIKAITGQKGWQPTWQSYPPTAMFFASQNPLNLELIAPSGLRLGSSYSRATPLSFHSGSTSFAGSRVNPSKPPFTIAQYLLPLNKPQIPEKTDDDDSPSNP